MKIRISYALLASTVAYTSFAFASDPHEDQRGKSKSVNAKNEADLLSFENSNNVILEEEDQSAQELERENSSPAVAEEDAGKYFVQGIMAYNVGDLERAKTSFLKAAELGESFALLKLGDLASEAGDINQAEKFYALAAEVGGSLIFSNLGWKAYNVGDLDKAKEFFIKAAELGSTDALCKLVSMAEGDGDVEGAEKFHKMAEKLKDVGAFYYQLGMRAHFFHDMEKTEYWLTLAAKHEHSDAQYSLGVLADEAGDIEKAKKWYALAAGNNHEEATWSFARMALQSDVNEFIDIFQTGVGKDYRFAACFLQMIRNIDPDVGFVVPQNNDPVAEIIADMATREDLLEAMEWIFGEDDPQFQYYINLAVGYENQANPDGFIAVHQEMMEKSTQEVAHNPQSSRPGLLLNLDHVKKCRPVEPIHMPLNKWHCLFDQVEAMNPDEMSVFEGLLGEVSLKSVMELRNNAAIVGLLDPINSACAKDNVDSYSQMLREILQGIHETQDLKVFFQLLLNIRTCQTGKLQGIMLSHIILRQERGKSEAELGVEGYKIQFIASLFSHLRKLRENALVHVVCDLTNGSDPHNIRYLRGILGQELGLMFEKEKIKVDMNASMVCRELREQSKQQLLDLFYNHYKVEDLVQQFDDFLGGESVDEKSRIKKQAAILKVINNFLEYDAMDETLTSFNPDLILLDAQKKPAGFTDKCIEDLFVRFGVLERK